jgi:mRNA-degrading endonuclease RelE of RelBE toxin-antitoxin system
MDNPLVTIVEFSAFAKKADKLLTVDERAALIGFLAANPLSGEQIVGTGGVRKLRFAAQGKGKSGGVRVIYYYLDDDIPLNALLLYAKGEKSDLSDSEKKIVASLAAAIKREWRSRK